MAGTETKRIIELTEASAVQSGDYFPIDSASRGTKKVPTDALATSAALTAETNARAGADEQMSERMDGIEEQTALIQNPTKTLSGALVSFTDGADMPMVACTASITPKQSGTGTPSPSNVRPISGWESVNLRKSGKNLLKNSVTSKTISGLTCTRNEDGTVHITGTATNSIALNIAVESDLNIPSGTYIVSGCPSGGSSSTYRLYIGGTDENGSGFGTLDIGSGKTVTVYSFTTIQIQVFPAAGAVDLLFKPMIRLASDTDPTYEPYTGTTTTVNLGRTVYGGTLDVVSGVLTAYPFYPSYNGETLDGRWICDRAVYAEGTTPPTGSQVALISGTSTTYQLTPTQINTLLGENNVWADSGDVEITYRRDISIVINNLESALNG